MIGSLNVQNLYLKFHTSREKDTLIVKQQINQRTHEFLKDFFETIYLFLTPGRKCLIPVRLRNGNMAFSASM